MSRRLLPLIAVTLAMAVGAEAQVGPDEFEAAFQAAYTKIVEKATKEADGAYTKWKQYDNPWAFKQVSASSSSPSAVSTVDSPNFSEFIGLALNSDLIDTGDDDSLTISLNLFAFAKLYDHSINDVQGEYERLSPLRRLSGSVTLGGKGESLDQDGDGEADDVPDAKHDYTVKLGAKLELPVSEGLKLPIGLTWANHKDLLSEDDDIVGNFALAFDLDAFLKKSKEKTQ